MSDLPAPPDRPDAVAPGWYPTADGTRLRYHNGVEWTQHERASLAATRRTRKRVAFVQAWAIAAGVWFLIYIPSLAAPDANPLVDGDASRAAVAGRIVGTFIGVAVFGALTAWPIWWLINRNRPR